MSEEIKEYMIFLMELLKESMKKEGAIFAVLVNKEDIDNSSICILDRERFVKDGKIDGIKIQLDELNKGLL